jgi:four helix bundle protein
MPSPRPATRTFRDLTVWQKAHEFVLAMYRFTESFPDCEKYGLAHQMRRAAVSVPANIAEGFGKRSQAEKSRFLNIAEGSLEECRYYLILAQDLDYGDSSVDEHTGRSQPVTQRICAGDSRFWLLTSCFLIPVSARERDIKGAALA